MRTNDGLGRFEWKDLQLKWGANTVEAVDPVSGARDKTEITVRKQLVLPVSTLTSDDKSTTHSRTYR